MKMNRGLKITFITLLIVLLAIISFVGLFVQDTKFMVNLLPDYEYGMDFAGYRVFTVDVSDDTETIYYDADGNVVDSEDEDGTSETVPVNDEEILTTENFEECVEIIESRLSDAGVSEYLVRLDEDTGSITVALPEDENTDTAVQYIYTTGEFTIEDEDGNVLLDNSNLASVEIGYGTVSTVGTTVYLTFEFNDDSVETLKDISNTYITTEDEDGEEVEYTVTLNIDGTSLVETSFDEEISDGVLALTLGTATDDDTLAEYLEEATNIATLLNSGKLPIEYTASQNRYLKTDVELQDFLIPAIVIGVILLAAFIVLIVKYKKIGLLGIISFVGYLAIVLIIVRYANVVITLEGICAILVSAVLNYMVLVNMLQITNNKDLSIIEFNNRYSKIATKMVFVTVPALIIGMVLCFASWLPVFSFGMNLFWGLLVLDLYNISITKILLKNAIKE